MDFSGTTIMATQQGIITVTDHGCRIPRSGRRGNLEKDHRASQVVSKRNPCDNEETKTKTNQDRNDNVLKIGTWNVRSMYEPGRMHNAIREMQRLNIDILGISDTRWPDSGQLNTTNGIMYFSGNDETHHRNGVAILVARNVIPSVIGFTPISDRIILLQLQTNKAKVNIIQIYAPTADKPDEEIELFYDNLQSVLSSTKTRDATIIIGDFNAKIGKGRCDKYVGEYGLGTRNERGDRLLEFCQTNNYIITNTFYKLPKRRLYTWKSPQDTKDRPIRNQIDYFLINERYRNGVKSVKAYPGADMFSDHNPVIARFQIKLKRMVKRTKRNQIDIRQLQKAEIRQSIKEEINNNLRTFRMKGEYENEHYINEKWDHFKSALMKPMKTISKGEKCKANQEWMTDEILGLMDKRRIFKNKCEQQYKTIQRQIRNKIRVAKENFYKTKCEEIEELQQKHDSFNIHKKVKELAGLQRRNRLNTLYDPDGKIITDTAEKLKIWKNYIEELFEDHRQKDYLEPTDRDEGPEITKEEILYALNTLKSRKAIGPDGLPSEILKLVEEEQVSVLVDLFNSIYKTGIIPREWLISTFITLPKKRNPKQCQDYRTISLMGHTLKTFLKVIHARIYRKLEQDISDTQFGFRNGLGTREALFALNVMSQRCLDMNQDMYLCFIDYTKAFDKVRHDQLLKLLKEKNLDSRDINIISNLYYNQRAVIQVEENTTEDIEIKRGVRQGCVLSPLLFNIYSEDIMNKALADQEHGIKINGRPVNNLRYADDTVLIAETLQDLQELIDAVGKTSEEHGLTLNTDKTKFMVITKSTQNIGNIYIHDQPIERVKKYNYLGTLFNETVDNSQEIKTRIEKARGTFMKMKKVFCSRDLSLELKIRLMRCYVLSVLYYGLESWTLKKNDMRKMEAFELWIYRRILRISWVERVTNIEVLRRMKKEREIILTIKERKLLYLGHIMRGDKYQLLQLIVQGKISGKRSVGRRRHSWLKNLREWFHTTNNHLFRTAVSKIRIALMIANLRNEDGT